MFMHRIKLKNILSFGPNEPELELKPLNVLIGPNGSGKSNFIEVMSFLNAVPANLPGMIQESGGFTDWLWHCEPKTSSLELEIDLTGPVGREPLRYRIVLASRRNGPIDFRVVEERLQDERQPSGRTVFYISSDGTKVVASQADPRFGHATDLVDNLNFQQPVLSQLKDPNRYPELTYVASELQRISLYRQWSFGRHTPARLPQKPDLPNNFLVEDMQNLGLVLNQLMREYEVKQRLLKALRDLYEGVSDFHVNIEYGSVQVFLQEGKITVPATRLSDGTLRYLSLLVILCHPDPPPMVCIEEPELGLHPDILPGLADLLREASERCQLVVTTHSDVLVDALTDTPESIVVCEKHEGQTTLKRLDKESLAHWLDKYRLGELWTSGELGGNRW